MAMQVVLGRPIRVDVAEDRPDRAQRSGMCRFLAYNAHLTYIGTQSCGYEPGDGLIERPIKAAKGTS